MRINRMGVLAAGHASVDFYQGAVPAVVPFLVAERHYGYVAASGIVLAATLLSSIVQPLFGAVADRWRLAWLIPVSMLVTGLGAGLAGPAGSYPLTWLAIALSGLGVAAYHPESARLARTVSGGSHVGMSWFSLGGNLGFAVAPLLVTPLLSWGGLAASPLLVLPAALGCLVTVAAMRSAGRGAGAGRTGTDAKDDWPAFVRLALVMGLRSVGYIGLSTFVALYAGGGTAGAVALFLQFAGGAVGTILGGRLATRLGRVRTLRLAYALAVPALAGVVLVPGPGLYVFAAAAGVTLYVPFSLHVTLGQDYLPRHAGTASGVTLGLAVSAGGVASPLVGALAEATSLRVALLALAVMPLLAWLLARPLREPAVAVPSR
ncbi:MFS transporter [Nonomuraea typhae]|uniref:MFS transporter n=1 Tax=Nonomuraea typhae TaxID=2603600 RepID=UPI001FECFDE1|nr:MFS transporter [Nonomuraea typhae]